MHFSDHIRLYASQFTLLPSTAIDDHGCNVSLIFPPFLLSFGNYRFTLGKYCSERTCMKLVVNSYLVDDWGAMSAFSVKGSKNMSQRSGQTHRRNTWSLRGDVWCWIAFGKNGIVPNMFSKFSRFAQNRIVWNINKISLCIAQHFIFILMWYWFNLLATMQPPWMLSWCSLMLFNISQILKADLFLERWFSFLLFGLISRKDLEGKKMRH